MALIDLDLAAKHVNVDATIPENAQTLMPKLEHATALVITYIKRPDHGWTIATDPSEDPDFAIVQAAILKVLANLYAFRGDEQPRINPLDEGVKFMLDLFRKPTLA